MFCVTYTLSLSVCWWTLRFFPISWPLYYRLRFSEPWGAYIFSSYFFLSSDKYPEVKLLDPRVVLFFEETSYCFPPTVFKGSFFSILSLTFFLSYILILASLTSVRGYLITVLVYIFPMLVIRASFHLSLCHLYVVFGKRCIQILCPVFNWTFFFFFAVELHEFFMYFGYWPLIKFMIFRYFLPFCRLPFRFAEGFLCCTEAF